MVECTHRHHHGNNEDAGGTAPSVGGRHRRITRKATTTPPPLDDVVVTASSCNNTSLSHIHSSVVTTVDTIGNDGTTSVTTLERSNDHHLSNEQQLQQLSHGATTTSSSPMSHVMRSTTNNKELDPEELVARSRSVVVSVLLFTSFILATCTYYLMTKNDYMTFVTEFESGAHQLIHAVNQSLTNVYTGLQMESDLYAEAGTKATTTVAGDEASFTTLHDFEIYARSIRQFSKSSCTIVYTPYIHTRQEFKAWNVYSKPVAPNGVFEYAIKNNSAAATEQRQPVPVVWNNGNNNQSMKIVTPVWQISSPTSNKSTTDSMMLMINFNVASDPIVATVVNEVIQTEQIQFSRQISNETEHLFGTTSSYATNGTTPSSNPPTSILMRPIFGTRANQKMTGFVSAGIQWYDFLQNTLPEDLHSVHVVTDTCGTNATFLINGTQAFYLGQGDLHDVRYNELVVVHGFDFDRDVDETLDSAHCSPRIYVFPTDALKNTYRTRTPKTYTSVIVVLFGFTAIVFVIYDSVVRKQQQTIQAKAEQTTELIQNLFPGDVAEQLLDKMNTDAADKAEKKRRGSLGHHSSIEDWQSFDGCGNSTDGQSVDTLSRTNRAIAELYPAATVLFADIAGFTAWSSMRDPNAVFTLLEKVFQSFDAIAKRLGIFKVETIGDCYVAVCGVPKANPEHAIQMARFARLAMIKFTDIIQSFEMTLGPDTVELGMRFGLHSGPVTAGVLRGDRARFQLFGDTVNTASRIETTGQRERIHISETTAMELIRHGKEDWVIPREDTVQAKGKGQLTTYWLKRTAGVTYSSSSSSLSGGAAAATNRENRKLPITEISHPRTTSASISAAKTRYTPAERVKRLVDWNSDLLHQLLRQIVLHRRCRPKNDAMDDPTNMISHGSDAKIINEVAEYIVMPSFQNMGASTTPVEGLSLAPTVIAQLHSFVETIASMYNDNPFHNFEHASHVAMSVNKLLSRIVSHQNMKYTPQEDNSIPDQLAKYLHDHSYGITSDPMVQFATVLAALIHDVDHSGVPNFVLERENTMLTLRYDGRSVAEQHSFNLAWSTLFLPQYDELRATILTTHTEMNHFRQIMIHAVIATDIFDKELGELRKRRWSRAFDEHDHDSSVDTHCADRKATIVIEHLIQASDVAHTMQHWLIYKKWNQRLFNEMYQAYCDGRLENDPSVGWYDGELRFFDNYVIPLAKKLRDCGVFGVSCDECLSYAMENRKEWACQGQAIVEQFVEAYNCGNAKRDAGGLQRFPSRFL